MTLTLGIHLRRLDSDGENRVGAGGMLIHVGSTHVPVYVSFVEDFHHVVRSFHHECRQVLHVHTRVLVSQLKPAAFLVEQVSDLLVVNLKVGCAHQVLLLGVRLDLLKDVVEGAGHDSLQHLVIGDTCDRESLACSGLTVGKDGAIVALDDILTDRVGCLSEDFGLFRAVTAKSVS